MKNKNILYFLVYIDEYNLLGNCFVIEEKQKRIKDIY